MICQSIDDDMALKHQSRSNPCRNALAFLNIQPRCSKNGEFLTCMEVRYEMPEYTYRCPMKCPIGKRCFIIKVMEKPKEPWVILKKCPAKKADIQIVIGGVDHFD